MPLEPRRPSQVPEYVGKESDCSYLQSISKLLLEKFLKFCLGQPLTVSIALCMLVENISDTDDAPQKTVRHLFLPTDVHLGCDKEYPTCFIFLNCYNLFLHFLQADNTAKIQPICNARCLASLSNLWHLVFLLHRSFTMIMLLL